jgi:competence protein ComEA
MPKGEWKEYFDFSKKQRNAVFILLGLMVVFIFFTFWYKPVFTSPTVDAKVQQQLTALSSKHYGPATADSLDEDEADSSKELVAIKPASGNHELFYFDPNTLNADGLRRLGFGEKTTAHIIEYRKTNRFKKPEDLYKIARIRKKTVERVLPYVKIGASNQAAVTIKDSSVKPVVATPVTTTGGNYKVININTATAEDFKAFPGVTDVVAARVIKFRTSIGGFKSIDDVAKTYGLPKASFEVMRPYLRL